MVMLRVRVWVNQKSKRQVHLSCKIWKLTIKSWTSSLSKVFTRWIMCNNYSNKRVKEKITTYGEMFSLVYRSIVSLHQPPTKQPNHLLMTIETKRGVEIKFPYLLMNISMRLMLRNWASYKRSHSKRYAKWHKRCQV